MTVNYCYCQVAVTQEVEQGHPVIGGSLAQIPGSPICMPKHDAEPQVAPDGQAGTSHESLCHQCINVCVCVCGLMWQVLEGALSGQQSNYHCLEVSAWRLCYTAHTQTAFFAAISHTLEVRLSLNTPSGTVFFKMVPVTTLLHDGGTKTNANKCWLWWITYFPLSFCVLTFIASWTEVKPMAAWKEENQS